MDSGRRSYDGERLVRVYVKETCFLTLRPGANVRFSKGSVISLRESVVEKLEKDGKVRKIEG